MDIPNPRLDFKPTATRLTRLGLFGNTLRTWDTPFQVPPDLRTSILFAIRYKEPGGPFVTELTHDQLISHWMEASGSRYVSEAAPHSRITIQGEYSRFAFNEPYFYYSYAKTSQREALYSSLPCLEARGMTALALLRYHLSPYSLVELDDIFEGWPLAIVELACFDHDVGHRPCRNTIIWEVREGY